MYFAWTIEGYDDKQVKNDPHYVKILMRMAGRKNGVIYDKILDYHECTQEDLKNFAPPTLDSERVLESILSDPNRALFCFDWDQLSEEMKVWGVSQYDDFQFIDFDLTPCQYNHTVSGKNDDVIAKECIQDFEAQKEYLGNLRAYVYMTEQVLAINKFGAETIERRSRFYQQ